MIEEYLIMFNYHQASMTSGKPVLNNHVPSAITIIRECFHLPGYNSVQLSLEVANEFNVTGSTRPNENLKEKSPTCMRSEDTTQKIKTKSA